MYHPRQGRPQDNDTQPSERPGFVRAMLAASTVIFWGSALIFVGLMVLYATTKNIGTVSSWVTGISLLLVTVSSGAIAGSEFGNNPLNDTERGEWTNKMLFYGLAFVFGFIVMCLYLPALYFAP